MMADLGGPQRPDDMPAKVARDVELTEADGAWVLMIVPGEDPSVVAGTVALWPHEGDSPKSEIGWMVLPEFQGQGLAKAAVGEVLQRARADGRWGVVHAFPSVTNVASNALCRALGFSRVAEEDLLFSEQIFRVNHWCVDTG
ncbi:MAG: hypothetical protein QOG53_2944 [Frankiales bacterium]|jgi:RimJ/RimL family protein N-acetyltransferase|nr:hypothetical protein [Frankiales bacterium]